MDRLLALARKAHDASLCASGAGPEHHRDTCDEDSEGFTDPQPEVVESTCVWLAAAEEYAEEAGKAQVRERGLMIGWRDGSAAERADDRFHEQDESGDREHERGDE